MYFFYYFSGGGQGAVPPQRPFSWHSVGSLIFKLNRACINTEPLFMMVKGFSAKDNNQVMWGLV